MSGVLLTFDVEFAPLDSHVIEIECPFCELNTWVTLGQIRLRQVVICRGCYVNLELMDHLGSVQRAVRRIASGMKNLG